MAGLPPDVIPTLILMSCLSAFFIMGFCAGRGRQELPSVIVLPLEKAKKRGKGKNRAARREMNRELEQVLASVMALLEDEECGNKAGSWSGGLPPGVFVRRRRPPVDYDLL
jgi:hypothetical protein